jgi:predicted TIM-barrel enzyme
MVRVELAYTISPTSSRSNNRFALYRGGTVGKLIGHAESIDPTPCHVIDEAVLQVTRVIRTDLITMNDGGPLPLYRMPSTRICDVDNPTEPFAGNASSTPHQSRTCAA